jgi:choline dehydrogenase
MTKGHTNEYRVPAWQLNAQEFDDMKWDFYVQHYADEARQAKDTKMVYTQTNGEMYVGLDPPAGATPKGILYPRSGTLGGCASHNAMVTVYPFESDWEYIQTLTGDDSWAPSNMRSYFEKLERNQYLPNSVIGHGFSGWLHTTLTPATLIIEDQKLLSIVLSAASAMGKVSASICRSRALHSGYSRV